MRSSYRNHYRQILPALLDVLDFHSNNTAYQPVIEALAVVREHVSSRLSWYPVEVSPPLEGVVPSSWEQIVTEKDSAGEERVNRLTWTSISRSLAGSPPNWTWATIPIIVSIQTLLQPT